jgi:hypothetical protein
MFFSMVMVVHARQTKGRPHVNSSFTIGTLAICVEEGGNIMQDATGAEAADEALNETANEAAEDVDDAANEAADESVNGSPDPASNESAEWCVPIYHPILLIPTDTVATMRKIDRQKQRTHPSSCQF